MAGESWFIDDEEDRETHRRDSSTSSTFLLEPSTISPPAMSMLPGVSECLAHLKLLECFYQLREDIGNSNGLFGIKDELVSPELNNLQRSELLAKLCEKRWQIYVTRACIRFQSYWRTLEPDSKMLLEEDLEKKEYLNIAFCRRPVEFTVFNLPPLGEFVCLI
jgi:hypothetical protein